MRNKLFTSMVHYAAACLLVNVYASVTRGIQAAMILFQNVSAPIRNLIRPKRLSTYIPEFLFSSCETYGYQTYCAFGDFLALSDYALGELDYLQRRPFHVRTRTSFNEQ